MAVDGSNSVRIDGLSKATKALEKAGVDAQDLKTLMHEIGMVVVRAANVPTRTGRLAASLKAGKGKTKAVVRAGGARVPYAGVVHYGWPAHNMQPQSFLSEALESHKTEVFNKLEDGIDDVLKRNNLK